jgi:hypothetical protein
MVPAIPGGGRAVARLAAAVPVVLIVLFVGLLWVIGLFCSEKRRKYVTRISAQGLQTVQGFFGDGTEPPALRGSVRSR